MAVVVLTSTTGALAAFERGIGVDGDQLEAGSPMDPSFWPIHPALDRLLHWKKIAQPFTDAGWADPDDPDATEYCMVVKDQRKLL